MDLFYQKIEQSIANKLQLTSLGAGLQIIRNEKGWRDNEVQIDYLWFVHFQSSSKGYGGIFSVKYNQNNFRDLDNPEQLVNGIFVNDLAGNINHIYGEDRTKNFSDSYLTFNQLDLYQANKGITIGGIAYRIRIAASNINTIMEVNNPNHTSWKTWEKEMWELSSGLAKRSENTALIKMFAE